MKKLLLLSTILLLSFCQNKIDLNQKAKDIDVTDIKSLCDFVDVSLIINKEMITILDKHLGGELDSDLGVFGALGSDVEYIELTAVAQKIDEYCKENLFDGERPSEEDMKDCDSYLEIEKLSNKFREKLSGGGTPEAPPVKTDE